MAEKGDFIKCSDKHDMLDVFLNFQKMGYDVEFCYEREGKSGYWLEILEVPDGRKS